ncbi:hypothetical protein AHF37_02842 [Paragonimus kellicotti]|nr:hypothetical protein AHF37_02842 [Paragonimus kellicotti]
MKQRGQAKSLLASMLVAGFSGISVAFATLSKRLAALIGNAISLSLLPPAVNSGQLLLLSMLAYSQKTTIHEVRGTYDCLHKLDAGELATYAYKEYLRLNQVNPEAADALDAEESQRIASDYCAVLQGVGKDPHVITVSAKAGQDNSQFLLLIVKISSNIKLNMFSGAQTETLSRLIFTSGIVNSAADDSAVSSAVNAKHAALF